MNTKPSETNGDLTNGNRVDEGAATLLENERHVNSNANESFLHSNGRKVDLLLKDNKSNFFGRKVAIHKAAFETLNSSTSASSSSNANSPPSLKKHELPAKTEIIRELKTASRQNESSAPKLASSQSMATFLTKQQSWKKTGSENKVTSSCSNIGNMKEEMSEDKEKITTIADKKSLFERSFNKDNLEDKNNVHSVKIGSKLNNKLVSANNYKDLKQNGDPNLPDLLDSP